MSEPRLLIGHYSRFPITSTDIRTYIHISIVRASFSNRLQTLMAYDWVFN